MPPRRQKRPEQETLEEFAEKVHRAVEKVATGPARETGTFGEKVFIHAAWAIGKFDMTLDEFKKKLVEAHRNRLVYLSRADLVEAMDPYAVKRSTTHLHNSTFHFISPR